MLDASAKVGMYLNTHCGWQKGGLEIQIKGLFVPMQSETRIGMGSGGIRAKQMKENSSGV